MMERVLNERYVLGEVIGSGGMAVVYQAYDRSEKREVAIKALRSEFNEDAEFVRRFNMEAQAASKMSHPNIVGIYGVGQDGDVRYIVMEYVKGRTLKEVIRGAGRIKPERAIQITLKILAAIDCAHKNHVVHRDIKPQNILVDVEGNIKVADFGIARATNSSTQTYADGNVLGSVHYFSPEQASGQVADEKSDLYSAGVVLYEMVTGEVPFDGETPISVALKHVQEPPKSARTLEPSVSKGLDEVILKSLDKESSCRYQTAAEMAADLKRAIRMPRGGFVDKPNLREREKKFTQRVKGLGKREGFLKKLRLWTVVVISAVLGFLLIYYGSQLYRQLFLRIEMPSLTMLDIEQAVENLDALELKHTLEERHNDEVRYGYVIEQHPAAGESVWPGDRVVLVMSTGKEKLLMPKLKDLTRSEAVRVIEENDLVLGDVVLDISNLTPGLVVSQSPGVNEWVKPGDKVALHISGESGEVPNLIGYTLDEARAHLIASGFELGAITEQISTQKSGLVIGQSLAEGEIALMGTKVGVTVSQMQPVNYRAQTTVVIESIEPGVEFVCKIVELSGEREVFSRELNAGREEIMLNINSFEPGIHIVRVYLDGELAIEKEIDFVEEA